MACCIAVFMVAMDNLIVTNALPVIRQALHTGLEGLEWTVNAYTLTFAVLLLTGAALGDRFGRRRLMIIGITVFTAGSAASALAPGIWGATAGLGAALGPQTRSARQAAAGAGSGAGLALPGQRRGVTDAPAWILERPRAATFHAVSIGPAPAFLSRPLPLGHDLTGKEGIMPTSSITTCTLCGLRFANRPLLEWHIREDHNRRPEPKERPSGAPPDDEAAAS